MVNRLRKGLWFLLIVFLAYFSSPGYPDSKKKTIHNLPVNQDMGTRFWRHSEGGERIVLEAMEQSDCPDCWTTLNNAIRCRLCVELREDCKDCCFSDKNPATGIIKCTEEDTSENYVCKSELFDRDDCDQVVCESAKCNTKCTNYDEYEADSPCQGVLETGGAVDSSANERRWQRKGCPEKDSEDLAPNGNCQQVEVGTKTGLERIWECDASDYQPKFSGCDPETASGLLKPAGYYSFVRIVTYCEPDCAQNECYADCPATSTGACEKPSGSCMPSCTPTCSAEISSGSSPGAGAKCAPSGCGVSQSCTASCINEGGACIAQECSSACGASFCESYSSRRDGSPSTFYVYTLSEEFKDYIEECIDYTDEYDACKDRLNCCEKGVCQDIYMESIVTQEYECAPGFSENCEDCEKRKCYYDDCAEFTAVGAENSCPQLASDVHSCLTKEENSGCFKEVKIGDEPFYYSYVASSNDALNIIWQVVSSSPDKDVKGFNFYTLVKVFKLDASGNPEEKPAHTSMANVKSQEAAFSIYGTTNVPKGKLLEGASYRVYLYYSLPPGEFCDEDCETCKNGATIELTYVSLILQRVRE